MRKLLSLLLGVFMLCALLAGCDAPNESSQITTSIYQELLNVYKEFIISEINEEDVSALEQSQFTSISPEVLKALKNVTTNSSNYSMGYSVKDINKDNTPELILIDSDYTVFAVFTVVNDRIVVVDDLLFENNHMGGIDSEGTIYKTGYSKGETGYCSIYKLSSSGELVGTTLGTVDSSDEIKYYFTTSNEKTYVTKEEYDELYSRYYYVFSNLRETTKNSGIEIKFILEFDPK